MPDAYLFDVYPHPRRSALVVWVKHGDRTTKRIVPYQPDFCVKAEVQSLEAAEKLLEADDRVDAVWRDRAVLWLRGAEEPVLRVRPKRLQSMHAVAVSLRKATASKGFLFFDVDNQPESRWMHEQGLWSLCRLAVEDGKPVLRVAADEDRWTVHYPNPRLKTLRLSIETQTVGLEPDWGDPLVSVRLQWSPGDYGSGAQRRDGDTAPPSRSVQSHEASDPRRADPSGAKALAAAPRARRDENEERESRADAGGGEAAGGRRDSVHTEHATRDNGTGGFASEVSEVAAGAWGRQPPSRAEESASGASRLFGAGGRRDSQSARVLELRSPSPGDPSSERDLLRELGRRLRSLDPDVIVTHRGDKWEIPFLLRRIRTLGLSDQVWLGRDPDVDPERPDQESKSLHTYGRWLFKTTAYYLRGRWHIDLSKKTLDSEDDRKDIHGILYLTRVSNRRAQDVNRNGAGYALQQMQIDLAKDMGVALPWKRNLAEDWKDAATLCAVDRGGQIMVPRPGIYEDVLACDFSGYYPSLVVRHNLSSDTINCRCCPQGPVIPELGYHVCTRNKGHQSQILERLWPHRRWAKAVLRKASHS